MTDTASSPAAVAALADRHAFRMDQLRAALEEGGWDSIVITDTTDIEWLVGMHSSNAAMVVSAASATLVTDFRYAAMAAGLGLDINVEQVSQGLYGPLGAQLMEWSGGGIVAYDPTTLTHREFLTFSENLTDGVSLRATTGVVAALRRVKDSGEIARIRRAAALLEGAYEQVVRDGLVGRTEAQVAWSIERWLREHGASAMSFESIVAGGHNGAYAHHATGDDVIQENTLVTIDIGCVVDGYCSDCTRAFATGPLPTRLAEIYDVTLRAQEASLAAVRAGANGRDIDAIARDIIAEAGYGDYFGHGLGHGVGMKVHESPRLSQVSTDTLAAGNVVTVEPGIYLPGEGGVRIEDLVVVTDDGCEILTSFPKALTTLGA